MTNAGHPNHKFLFVIDNLSTGGAQRQMVNLAVGLKKRGYQIELFCYAAGDLLAQPLYEHEIPIHWQIKPSRYSPDVVFQLVNLIRKGRYDLLLAFQTTPNFYIIISALLSGKWKTPIIVSERICDYPGWVSRQEILIRNLYRCSTFVVTNSHNQRFQLAKQYPFLTNRLRTIYNGYDLQFFYPPQNEPENNPPRILVIASVSYFKNGICLVRALKRLRDEYGLLVHVDWVGQREVTGHRLDALREMEREIQEYHLEDQWHWLGQRTDIVQQLHQHEVLVHPSYVEGLPNVVCEALACGRPVIVSNALDHPNLVQDGISGFLFDWRSPEQLAKKIKAILEMPVEQRHEMGRNGRTFAEQHLGLDRYVSEFEELIQASLKMKSI
jgi:glycosyltransferase involved in cell wall biosynthesis